MTEQDEVKQRAQEVADLAVVAVSEHFDSRMSKDEIESRLVRLERRIRHFVYGALAVAFALMVVTAYAAVWAHEVYRDKCEFAGTVSPSWCHGAFYGDDEFDRARATGPGSTGGGGTRQ